LSPLGVLEFFLSPKADHASQKGLSVFVNN